jgi:hypothetical protein
MRILEHEAKIKPAIVRAIQRQSGEYRDAVSALAQGKTWEGLEMLNRQGWVKEIGDDDGRYRLIAKEYADSVGSGDSVLAIAPTHAEGERMTANIRKELQDRGLLEKDEREFEQLRPLRLTEAEKSEPDRLGNADVLVFHNRAVGHKKGERVSVASGLPKNLKESSKSFEAYERRGFAIAKGDSIRITANGKTKDKQHRLNNGAIYKVRGFSKEGDIQLNNGWIVSKDYGFLSSGYVATSHGSQGKTVDRVLIAESAVSYPAAGREQFYVSVSRGKKSATIYTDDRESLAEAVSRTDPRMSATELVNDNKRKQRAWIANKNRSAEKPREAERIRDMERMYG